MPKAFRYIGYVLLFIVSFFVFLYWTFPYEVLKDRLVQATEQQLGSDYSVRVGELSPSFFTGAVLNDVKIVKYSGDKTVTVWRAAKVKFRASLGSILFGRTNVSFSVKNQKSYVSGTFKTTDDGFNFTGSFSDFNLGDFGLLGSDGPPSRAGEAGGAKLSSAIDGKVQLAINKRQIIQSSGVIELTLADIKAGPGDIKFSDEVSYTIPELILSKGSSSTLKMELSKGAIRLKEFKLQDGDLKMDLSGDVFMSTVLSNYRMNLRGAFSTTPKLDQAMPFLFMVEKQRQPDGSYPLTITGRVGQPSIKIGDFILPI